MATRTSPGGAPPVYDGYATIRSRGLWRSHSIRAVELESDGVSNLAVVKPLAMRTPKQRRRTLSLRSDSSQRSNFVAEDVYLHPTEDNTKKKAGVDDSCEPIYANSSNTRNIHPFSDNSSSSGGGSVTGCRDSVTESLCSSGALGDYRAIKKNSQFSLDSVHSSNTPKTPDFSLADEKIFLYTAPLSPKRHVESESKRCSALINMQNNSLLKDTFEICELPSPTKQKYQSPYAALTHRQSLPTWSANKEVDSSSEKRTNGKKNSIRSEIERGGSYTPRTAPATPIRRESLYGKPKVLPNSKTNLETSTWILQSHRPISIGSCHSISNEFLTKSWSTNQSSATIDKEEELVVPIAMPMLPTPIDRRYHTLGHVNTQRSGRSLHRKHIPPLGSMLNMNENSYFNQKKSGSESRLQSNNSYGNLYETIDIDYLAPEYVDPLDIKIGCQSTLRSKPIIPWYELAIKRDLKRQSCPPLHSTMSLQYERTGGTSAPIYENQAHVVAAFEQSLSNMTSRLQQLTATSERKDDELTDMRQTIELLRKQSVQAGLTTAHMQSMGVQTQKQTQNELLSNNPLQISKMSNRTIKESPQHPNQITPHAVITPGNMSPAQNNGDVIHRHHSSDSMCSLNSIGSNCSTQDKKKKKGWLRSSFTKAFSRNAKISKTSRHVRQPVPVEKGDMPKYENYQNDNRKIVNVKNPSPLKTNGYEKSVETLITTTSNNREPFTTSPKRSPTKTVTLIENAKPIDAIDDNENQVVEELKKQLREKDLVLTDIRLEALSSASQLESLKETVNKMRAEMLSLKQNNERLQKLVTSRSLTGSDVSLSNAISPSGSMGESRRYSLADNNGRPPMELPKRPSEDVEEENVPPDPAPEPSSPTKSFGMASTDPSLDINSTKHIEAAVLPSSSHKSITAEEVADVTDGKKISIACYLGQPESFPKYCEEILEADEYYANSTHENESKSCTHYPTTSLNEFVIAFTYISGKTTWQNLDYIVRKTFKDYLSRIDPGTNLGLNTDSITSYHLGEAKRGPEVGFPELLPCGYIIGNVRTLYICLQGVGSLAFDSLIPRSIVHRYISLLTEHRRLILCGPSGTGKSYLARRLAEFIVARSGRGNPSEAIATFNVDHKSSKELRQYLSHIAEQTAIANGAFELPSVIILDNLHHASALGDVFSCLLSAGPAVKLPCIIGTMSQATCNTTNLQLHHNFRWVLTANHMEPVKGFLGRFLRRRLFQLELNTQHPLPELAAVLAWLPTVWQHINRFLEVHSSSDVTIGPRLFLSCPLDLKDSQVWFTDIWNYHLSPYLVEAVREGVQLYGRRGGVWNDPSVFIRKTYPWPYGSDAVPPLRQINAEDVGLEGVPVSNGENQDPLLNMLMRLQEAANYSECHDQESDCASLDSNLTPDSSAGAE